MKNSLIALSMSLILMACGDSEPLDEIVNAEEPVGECGNSGFSDLPHGHFHVQDSPDFLDIVEAHGIPPTFHTMNIDAKCFENALVERGSLVGTAQ